MTLHASLAREAAGILGGVLGERDAVFWRSAGAPPELRAAFSVAVVSGADVDRTERELGGHEELRLEQTLTVLIPAAEWPVPEQSAVFEVARLDGCEFSVVRWENDGGQWIKVYLSRGVPYAKQRTGIDRGGR